MGYHGLWAKVGMGYHGFDCTAIALVILDAILPLMTMIHPEGPRCMRLQIRQWRPFLPRTSSYIINVIWVSVNSPITPLQSVVFSDHVTGLVLSSSHAILLWLAGCLLILCFFIVRLCPC
ncbi:hypothetical protein FIBSPDRAFT_423782 [Athelia psychrophila]|uniref:Uncharacterized protein n=1 Tax=Athelia psychrophila TaxID=1759441 RepID=A0A166MZ63_9AGAM|nr:hypothetical protein FIBSPDRAFT_423782 [Fibularhizoctonia sp. CBS 109695]